MMGLMEEKSTRKHSGGVPLAQQDGPWGAASPSLLQENEEGWICPGVKLGLNVFH